MTGYRWSNTNREFPIKSSNLELLARKEKTHLQEFSIPLPNLLALKKITDA
jgi:hypothetical protein